MGGRELCHVFRAGFFTPIVLVRGLLGKEGMQGKSSVIFLSSVSNPIATRVKGSVCTTSGKTISTVIGNVTISLTSGRVHMGTLLPKVVRAPLVRYNSVARRRLGRSGGLCPLEHCKGPRRVTCTTVCLLSGTDSFAAKTGLMVSKKFALLWWVTAVVCRGMNIGTVTTYIPSTITCGGSLTYLVDRRRISGVVGSINVRRHEVDPISMYTSSLYCGTTLGLVRSGRVSPRSVSILLFIDRASSCHVPTASYILRRHLNLSGTYTYLSLALKYSNCICTLSATCTCTSVRNMGEMLLLSNRAFSGVIGPESGIGMPLCNSTKATALMRGKTCGSSMFVLGASKAKTSTMGVRNKVHRPVASSSYLRGRHRSNGCHASVRVFVSKVSMFGFTVDMIPGKMGRIVGVASSSLRSVSCLIFRRSGGFVASFFMGELGFSRAGIPCYVTGCKGADSTSMPLAVISRLSRGLGRRGMMIVYNFNTKLS